MNINLRQRMTPKKNIKKTIFWESSWPRKAAVGRLKKWEAKARKATAPKRWLLSDMTLHWNGKLNNAMATANVIFL